jgi:hypothetical protein
LFSNAITKQLARDVLGSYFVDTRPMRPYICQSDDGNGDGQLSALKSLPIPADIARLHDQSIFGAGPAFDRIIQTVAETFQLDVYQLAGDNSATFARKRDIAMPRQIAIYLARERTNIAVVELARLFGGVSHSAVSHAHTKMGKQIQADPKLGAQVQSIIDNM